jgi:hypothetical protein
MDNKEYMNETSQDITGEDKYLSKEDLQDLIISHLKSVVNTRDHEKVKMEHEILSLKKNILARELKDLNEEIVRLNSILSKKDLIDQAFAAKHNALVERLNKKYELSGDTFTFDDESGKILMEIKNDG